jgi:peptidyl-prolyl cis-trans isomerase C
MSFGAWAAIFRQYWLCAMHWYGMQSTRDANGCDCSMSMIVKRVKLCGKSPWLAALLVMPMAAMCADVDALKAISTRGEVTLVVQDIDTVLDKAPENQRSAIVSNPTRLDQIIETEMITKQLAAKGRTMGLDDSDIVKRRLERAVEQELAALTLETVIRTAPKQDFMVLAHESYLANDSEFQVPEASSVQHILIARDNRTPEEVSARANEVLKKAQAAGANFEALVTQYSDDPSKVDNKGIMEVSQPGQFVTAFENAAKALKKIGDLSPLVETEFGTHILVLKARSPARKRSFDEVKAGLVETLEAEYKEKTKAKFLSDLRAANPVINADVVEIVRTRYGALPDFDNLDQAADDQAAQDAAKQATTN